MPLERKGKAFGGGGKTGMKDLKTVKVPSRLKERHWREVSDGRAERPTQSTKRGKYKGPGKRNRKQKWWTALKKEELSGAKKGRKNRS